MERVNCPFLGLKDDPTTALDFPSQGNFCHHSQPASPVKGAHQQQFCLTAEHTACPMFLAAHPIPLPPAIASPGDPQRPSLRTLAILVVPALLAGATALILSWNGV